MLKKFFTRTHFSKEKLGQKFPIKKIGGFTLIELLIAIFIVVVGILAILQAFPLGIRIIQSGQMITIASYLAQAKIEEDFSKSYDELLTGIVVEEYGEIAEFNNFKRITKVNCIHPSDLSEVSCDYDLNDPYPMKKIEVAVSWKPSLGISERNIKVATLVGKK